MNYTIYNGELYHYGVPGMKWGHRKLTREDGSLTGAGKRQLKKVDKQLQDSKKSWDNRVNVENEMRNELRKTKEHAAAKDILMKRGVVDKDGRIKSLSYMKEDWSNPDKVVDKMAKDTGVLNAYAKKQKEIQQKFLKKYSEAAVKDLGYDDVKAASDFVMKNGLLNYKVNDIMYADDFV